MTLNNDILFINIFVGVRKREKQSVQKDLIKLFFFTWGVSNLDVL